MAVNKDDRRDHALDAEWAVLGSLLIDPGIQQPLFAKVRPEHFMNQANRLIFTAARDLYRAGEPVDAVTVRAKVGQEYTDYLRQLRDMTPTSANWREYAALMHSQATTQRIKNLAQYILENAVTLDDCRQPVSYTHLTLPTP